LTARPSPGVFLVDLEVEQARTDAVQAFVSQETVFVELTTADGGSGLGYAYTIGTGGSSVAALLRDHLLPRCGTSSAAAPVNRCGASPAGSGRGFRCTTPKAAGCT
jgi:L-alanine-DL-glutamate epimerase-like enolase superfamily enzyme